MWFARLRPQAGCFWRRGPQTLAHEGIEIPLAQYFVRQHLSSVGIPVKVNGDSSGKPNGVPVKANSRRSDATLACLLCIEVFGFVKLGASRGDSGAKQRSFGGDLGCRGKWRPAPLSPAYLCRSKGRKLTQTPAANHVAVANSSSPSRSPALSGASARECRCGVRTQCR
jgi:hypothetical protein